MKKRTKLAIACAAAVFLGVSCNLSLKAVNYSIETEKLSGTVKLAFISDVHNALYGKGQSELTAEIEEFGADIVLFGGDIFDEFSSGKNSWTLVEALVKDYPCFYAAGNHEFNTGRASEIKKQMAELGVTVLEDDTSLIEVGGQKIRICGTENVWEENAVSQLDDTYSVLLHHYPHNFPKLWDKGFDLILAGHAHGGQWRIPGILNGLYAPDQGLFPEYAGGYYSENGTDMIVSRGLIKGFGGYLFIPRVFNRPELVLITLD